ncbi:MAG: redox-regulated ATPase YchF [Actinobacteria bacterium]|nr:redox-regulated ATPase YchF [Actinomycetota bacterium]
MKDIGIVGMPFSGKSTLFTALTRAGSAGGRSHQAVVEVPDERIAVLAVMEKSRKRVPAKVKFVDVPGGLTAQGIGEFRQMDALCMVVRAYGADADPKGELASLEVELVLADLASVENGLDKARKKSRGAQANEARAEVAALEQAHALLEAERPLTEGTFDEAGHKVLSGYGALTLKPWIVVANVAEEDAASGAPDGFVGGAIPISAALEAEVAGLDDAEAAELLGGFGIEERGLDRVVAACYRALDLITFLTTGEDETRAWEVRRGAKAPEAAGVIHTDLQRGFIRAEVVGYDDLVGAGSWDSAKGKGLLRVEGKDYTVGEGDVLNIRFAV